MTCKYFLPLYVLTFRSHDLMMVSFETQVLNFDGVQFICSFFLLPVLFVGATIKKPLANSRS
jgi:hypothetical protein